MNALSTMTSSRIASPILLVGIILFNFFVFQSSVHPSALDVQPFLIRPAIFELQHKEATLLEVVFQPTVLGHVSQEVLILCDNCHMKEFTFTGISLLVAICDISYDIDAFS